MSYVVQQPGSSTNPTEEYKVVDADSWFDYINGLTQSFVVVGSFAMYSEAESYRDQMNQSAQ